jgi:hypothetical protein
MSPRLVGLDLSVDRSAWVDVGLLGSGGTARLGEVLVDAVPGPPTSSSVISRWIFDAPMPERVDGLPTATAIETQSAESDDLVIDHVVVMTGDLDRTVSAFASAGLQERRRRDVRIDQRPHQQVFFRPGSVIVELVGPVEPTGQPASFWGITFTVRDLDEWVDRLGPDVLSPARTAVQPGRRIATFRSAAGLGIPIALMSPHVR